MVLTGRAASPGAWSTASQPLPQQRGSPRLQEGEQQQGVLSSARGDSVIDPATYFDTQRPPANLESVRKDVEAFVTGNSARQRPIVLVTSGGTMVPLENNTVRFIDNFSNGTRGASSAEWFVRRGYAVIFMHREHSLQPFNRNYTMVGSRRFLDHFVLDDATGEIKAHPDYTESIKSDYIEYKQALEDTRLLMVTFVSLSNYLFLLREVSHALAAVGHRAMFYLAAAVSDFFIPSENMAEHKIQSRGGNLTLEMNQVPKFLKPLVTNWAPEGYIVSFKLETDHRLLESKARHALASYGHQIVIANMLQTRKHEVWLIEDGQPAQHIELGHDARDKADIEQHIVEELAKRHARWMERPAAWESQ